MVELNVVNINKRIIKKKTDTTVSQMLL